MVCPCCTVLLLHALCTLLLTYNELCGQVCPLHACFCSMLACPVWTVSGCSFQMQPLGCRHLQLELAQAAPIRNVSISMQE